MVGRMRAIAQTTRQAKTTITNLHIRRVEMKQLKELMSRDVKVIDPDMSIVEAAKKMRDGGFGIMPVG